MLYLIYDTAKHNVPGLIALKAQFPIHDLLLDRRFDADVEYVAPWIFQISEEHLDTLKNLEVDTQNLLWFESKATFLDIVKVFQKIIYNNDPENAKQFFRVWDINILVQELAKPKDNNPALELFKVIKNIYLLNDEMMKAYYLDFWGVLNTKTVQNILTA